MRAAITETFALHAARSVQHTLYAIANVVLATYEEILDVTLAMHERPYRPADLFSAQVENPDELFVAAEEPLGVVEVTVERDPASLIVSRWHASRPLLPQRPPLPDPLPPSYSPSDRRAYRNLSGPCHNVGRQRHIQCHHDGSSRRMNHLGSAYVVLYRSAGGATMLFTIAVILLVLWLLGLVSGYTLGNFIYVLLVIALVLFVVGLVSGRRTV